MKTVRQRRPVLLRTTPCDLDVAGRRPCARKLPHRPRGRRRSAARRWPRSASGWPGIVYYRWHGSPRAHFSPYSDADIGKLASAIQSLSAETWCIFDNTGSGSAAGNALDLTHHARNTAVARHTLEDCRSFNVMNPLLRDLDDHQVWADTEDWRAIGAHPPARKDQTIRICFSLRIT
jgi:uncharacterized protein DUF72